MVGVGKAHGHHEVAYAQVGPAGERLLHPELLELHLAAFLGLLLPLAGFLELLLNGSAATAVLKLNLARHGPALAEVVAYVNHGVGDVEAAVAGVVLVAARLAVAVHVVAVEVARQCHLAVAAYAQAVTPAVGGDAVEGCLLRHGRRGGRERGQGHGH